MEGGREGETGAQRWPMAPMHRWDAGQLLSDEKMRTTAFH